MVILPPRLAGPAAGWSRPRRDEALSQMRTAITDMLVADEIVDLEIATPVPPAAYAETFGMFRDDPTFAEFVEEVNLYRQEQNRVLTD